MKEEKALVELFRLLKNGGQLFIMKMIDREHTYKSGEIIAINHIENPTKEFPVYRLHGRDYHL